MTEMTETRTPMMVIPCPDCCGEGRQTGGEVWSPAARRMYYDSDAEVTCTRCAGDGYVDVDVDPVYAPDALAVWDAAVESMARALATPFAVWKWGEYEARVKVARKCGFESPVAVAAGA